MKTYRIKTESEKQEILKRKFDYHCKQASRCRHENYKESCYSCMHYETCSIQRKISELKAKLIY